MLDNLVRNALEAMPDGGDLKLDWLHGDNHNVFLIEISDTGRGMPEELMRSIVSGEVVASTKRSGSGIGMLSVAALLKRLGGDIAGKSRPGAGTSWTISVPSSADQETLS
jgi:two-component system, sporulation sensor kinase E